MPNCPWHGLPCDCQDFPFLKNGIIPAACEESMPDEILGVRKVSDSGKARYKAYQAELEENRRKANGKA